MYSTTRWTSYDCRIVFPLANYGWMLCKTSQLQLVTFIFRVHRFRNDEKLLCVQFLIFHYPKSRKKDLITPSIFHVKPGKKIWCKNVKNIIHKMDTMAANAIRIKDWGDSNGSKTRERREMERDRERVSVWERERES